MFDEFPEHVIRQTVLVCPLGISENPVESVGIRFFNPPQGILNGLSHVPDYLSGGFPVCLLGNQKTMLLGQCGVFPITSGFL